MAGWCVYILGCGDGTLYTGATNDLPARLRLHRSGKGARYTRGRGPLQLRYVEACGDKSRALVREHQLKRLSRAQKLALCNSSPPPRELDGEEPA